MDPTRFDRLAALLAGRSRRAVLRALVGGSAVAVVRGGDPAAAACLAPGQKCRKSGACCTGRCKKRNGRRTGKCTGCGPGKVFCPDLSVCLGCCSDADCGGRACDNGSCAACPRGEKLCNGGCIPDADCCGDADCGGKTCCNGACADTASSLEHCGGCGQTCPTGAVSCTNRKCICRRYKTCQSCYSCSCGFLCTTTCCYNYSCNEDYEC